MNFCRAFSTMGCPDFTLAEACALAGRHGIETLELRALEGTVDLPEYLTRQFGTPEKFAAHLRRESVRIAALGTSWKLVGSPAAERDKFLEFLPWAEAAGISWLRIFDGACGAGQVELAEAQGTLRWWHELREARRWRAEIMVETHDSLFTAATLQRFRVAAPATAILWDSHHTWKHSGEDLAVTWAVIREAVVHVHVKDSVPIPSARHPYTYVLPGEGDFPMRELREALGAANYAGPLSLEWEKLWHPTLPPLEVALQAAARGWW